MNKFLFFIKWIIFQLLLTFGAITSIYFGAIELLAKGHFKLFIIEVLLLFFLITFSSAVWVYYKVTGFEKKFQAELGLPATIWFVFIILFWFPSLTIFNYYLTTKLQSTNKVIS